MIKNIQKIALVSALMVMPLMASDDIDDEITYSLIGVEAGYGKISTEITDKSGANVVFKTDDINLAHLALKLGAESEHYRIFLSGSYAQDSDSFFDYVMNYEVEGDYLFNFSRYANFFVGIHGGITYMKFVRPTETFSRTIDSSYYGGNVGFNIHATRSIDVELGARYSVMDAVNTKSDIEYNFTDDWNGYCSIIFKYQLD